jgi:hypothetical protein
VAEAPVLRHFTARFAPLDGRPAAVAGGEEVRA